MTREPFLRRREMRREMDKLGILAGPIEDTHRPDRRALDHVEVQARAQREAAMDPDRDDAAGAKIFHVGDTGYYDGSLYDRLGAECGPFRLAVLPIGAYEPRWFMSDNHMNPEEAVKVMLSLKAEAAIGHHWGTFQLTDEGVERPPEALKLALAAAKLPEERFAPMRPGMSWVA